MRQTQMEVAPRRGKMLPAERVRLFRQEASTAIEKGNRVASQFSSVLKLVNVRDGDIDIKGDSFINEYLQEAKDTHEKILWALQIVNLDNDALLRPLLETNERLSSVLQEYDKVVELIEKQRKRGTEGSRPFNYAEERPKILACIAETSHATITLLNALRHANSDTRRDDINMKTYLSQAVDRQAELIGYIHAVENEEMIGTLLETEDRVTKALQLYEQLVDGDTHATDDATLFDDDDDQELERTIRASIQEESQLQQSDYVGPHRSDVQLPVDSADPPPSYSEIDNSPIAETTDRPFVSAEELHYVAHSDHTHVELTDPFADPF